MNHRIGYAYSHYNRSRNRKYACEHVVQPHRLRRSIGHTNVLVPTALCRRSSLVVTVGGETGNTPGIASDLCSCVCSKIACFRVGLLGARREVGRRNYNARTTNGTAYLLLVLWGEESVFFTRHQFVLRGIGIKATGKLQYQADYTQYKHRNPFWWRIRLRATSHGVAKTGRVLFFCFLFILKENCWAFLSLYILQNGSCVRKWVIIFLLFSDLLSKKNGKYCFKCSLIFSRLKLVLWNIWKLFVGTSSVHIVS